MSDPRSDLIDGAQPEAEQRAIQAICGKIKKGLFIAVWNDSDGWRTETESTRLLAEGSVPDEEYNAGMWWVFEQLRCDGRIVHQLAASGELATDEFMLEALKFVMSFAALGVPIR